MVVSPGNYATPTNGNLGVFGRVWGGGEEREDVFSPVRSVNFKIFTSVCLSLGDIDGYVDDNDDDPIGNTFPALLCRASPAAVACGELSAKQHHSL